MKTKTERSGRTRFAAWGEFEGFPGGFHIVHQQNNGTIVSACGIIVFKHNEHSQPDHFFDREPSFISCCTSCSKNGAKFLKAHGGKLEWKRTHGSKKKEKAGGDEYFNQEM